MIRNAPLAVACVAAWNAEAFIADTLQSLAVQTYPNLKVLISDDASDDRTAFICEEFAQKDFRFHVFRQPSRVGWIANVNSLLHSARGDYFLIVPHDDVLHPAYVARLVEALEKNLTAVLAFSDIELINLNGDREVQAYKELEGIEERIKCADRMLSQRGLWSIPYRGVFRASAIPQIGGLKSHWAGELAADWPWLVHMCLLGELIRVPEVLYTRIIRKNSLSRIWTYTARGWLASTLACGREIYVSRLSIREKILLNIPLARASLRWGWQGLMFHLARLLKRP